MAGNEAIVFSAERTVEIESRDVPNPNEGEVLIETERSLISPGTERAMLAGTHQPDNLPDQGGFPLEPGYSTVGHVTAVGPGVDEGRVGDRVGSATPHASYVTAPAPEVVPVPASVSTIDATFFRLAAVSMNAVRRGELAWGEAAAVRGLGIVGQLALRTALVAGAAPVYGIDLDTHRLDAAPDHGRVEQIDASATDPAEAIAPMVVDATGNPDTLGEGVSFLEEDGRYVVVGCPRRTVEFDFYRDCIVPSTHIIGAYRIPAGGEGRWYPRDYGELFLEYLATGGLNVAGLVTAEPHPSDAPAVYAALLDDPTSELGVVFDWT